MKIAIIAEYNPFHYGHAKQLKYLRDNFKNAQIVIFMNYHYTQRGEVVSMNYQERIRMAKQFGANEVVEVFNEESINAAPYFALNIIKKFPVHNITHICFGSELGELDLLNKIAFEPENNLDNEYQIYRFRQKNNLSNDILAIEYLRVIKKLNLKIEPIVIKREVNYDSEDVFNNITSASYIRKLFLENKDFSKYVPSTKNMIDFETKMNEIFLSFQSKIINHENSYFEDNLHFELGKFQRIRKFIYENNLENFLNKTINKDMSKSNLRRTILSVYLNLKK